MKYPYFQNITKIDTKVYLNKKAEKILYKKGIENFLNSTLRAKLGKSLNKLRNSKSENKKILGISIILLGPYNNNRDIYSGTVELFIQNDGFGRQIYSETYRVFNQKSEIQKDIEEAIEILSKWFVSDYFKIVDFDYSKMSEKNKIFFLFKYRGDFDYLVQKWDIWDTIKKQQQAFSDIFKDLSKKSIKREKTKDKNTRYAYINNFSNKGKNIVIEFWDYSKNKKFKYAKKLCIDSNNDGILNIGIQKKFTDALLIGIKDGEKRYYYDLAKCNKQLQNFYNQKINNKKESTKSNSLSGTGFFISKDGHLLTNYHVIKDSEDIKVLYKDKNYKAKVISIDKTNDIALIKIDQLTNFLPIAEYPKLEKGENVTSLGFPLVRLQGNELKATFGHINSLSGIQNDIRYLQFDNPTQPGNSGSPLINQNGEVIGIVSARLNQNTTIKYSGTLSQNVNYAIKMDYVLPIIKQNNIQTKSIKYPKQLTEKEIVKKYEEAVVLIVTNKK